MTSLGFAGLFSAFFGVCTLTTRKENPGQRGGGGEGDAARSKGRYQPVRKAAETRGPVALRHLFPSPSKPGLPELAREPGHYLPAHHRAVAPSPEEEGWQATSPCHREAAEAPRGCGSLMTTCSVRGGAGTGLWHRKLLVPQFTCQPTRRPCWESLSLKGGGPALRLRPKDTSSPRLHPRLHHKRLGRSSLGLSFPHLGNGEKDASVWRIDIQTSVRVSYLKKKKKNSRPQAVPCPSPSLTEGNSQC